LPDTLSLKSWLAAQGHIFARFEMQDSGCFSYGIENERGRFFVKFADKYKARAGLARSAALHRQFSHPLLAPLRQVIDSEQGPILVYDWVEGESLYQASGRLNLPDSAPARFRRLSPEKILASLSALYDLHAGLADLGYVMVDFYDGCLLYDFGTDTLHVVDLDEYRTAPFHATSRLPGSQRFMAPEENQAGELIDQVSNVFTLGRCARSLLGESPESWRGGAELWDVTTRATESRRARRQSSVAEFLSQWRQALSQSA
jgi:serine/threonine-protein kinase